MTNHKHTITIFEHDTLRLGRTYNDVLFEEKLLLTFQKFYADGKPFYNLVHQGIVFNEFVGVIQVGNILVEVLPKADKQFKAENEQDLWRNILIDMLRTVGNFEIKTPNHSNLKIKPNTILDLYFELFINEAEYLLHKGLVKKYRKTQGNVTALKGNLLFGKHLQKNLTHKERFYVRHNTYDIEHTIHFLLYKTILLLKVVNTNQVLSSRIGALLLNFPEMPDIKVTEHTFDKIILNRKTLEYEKALEIARLLLLNYHPDISKGRNHMLALMFDMNLLWEQFVLVSLKKNKDFKVRGQNARFFWKPDDGNRRRIRPDITIIKNNCNYVLDTKWKMVDTKPSMEDIRQMYAYHHYFEAEKVALLYPGKDDYISGKFMQIQGSNEELDLECGLMFTKFESSVKCWQEKIGNQIHDWIKTTKAGES